MNVLYALIVLSLISSCSESKSGNKSSSPSIQNLESVYGTYQALLHPVNPQLSSHLSGSATVVRESDELTVDVRLSGGPVSILHRQSMHIGTRCPTVSDDLNRDGYIDAEEGARVYREILIPLDDDLTSQRMGGGIYPVADEFGNYLWSRTTPYEKLMRDLNEEDINPRDDFVKLNHQKSFSLIGKVVVIKGVLDTTELPATVLGRGRDLPHESIPVACGTIHKLNNVPGVVDTDQPNIPLPSDEGIGGSSGEDDGVDLSDIGDPATTGNYGEE